MSIGGHQKNTKNPQTEWITPKHIIKALGPFDLDPCAAGRQPWPTARHHFTRDDDGLARPWSGFVWLNPPYGRNVGKWLACLAAHRDGGIALVFARTETEAFFEHVWPHADSLLFLRGRLRFHHEDGRKAAGTAGAPSVLIGYGKEARHRLMTSYGQLPGVYVSLRGEARVSIIHRRVDHVDRVVR